MLTLFKQVAGLSPKVLKSTIIQILKQRNYKIYETDNYICGEGDIPIGLVAHLDTVFPTQPTQFYLDKENNVLWSPDGLGADDRAGVCAILKIIKDGYKPHVIFTLGYEKNYIGAKELVKNGNPFKKLRYLIELNYKGSQDCVFYDCKNQHFIDFVQTFGFDLAQGKLADITFLCPSWNVAGVNLSIGYLNEHSFKEVLFIDYLENTTQKVKKMLDRETKISEEFLYNDRKRTRRN